MPETDFIMHVSFTELPQFRRLVQFVEDVEGHADAQDDYELAGMVREVQDDLLTLLGD